MHILLVCVDTTTSEQTKKKTKSKWKRLLFLFFCLFLSFHFTNFSSSFNFQPLLFFVLLHPNLICFPGLLMWWTLWSYYLPWLMMSMMMATIWDQGVFHVIKCIMWSVRNKTKKWMADGVDDDGREQTTHTHQMTNTLEVMFSPVVGEDMTRRGTGWKQEKVERERKNKRSLECVLFLMRVMLEEFGGNSKWKGKIGKNRQIALWGNSLLPSL